MRIAIHAADLDSERIDGTRVYIYNVLKHLGKISPQDDFLIYHKGDFNKALVPPELENYKIRKIKKFPFWTQTAFAFAIWKDRPDALWMPVTNIPVLRRRSLRVVSTVHDLAYRYFPQYFPKKDLFKLKLFANIAARLSAGLIAVSQSTKNDILKIYPYLQAEKIRVVHHGFDPEIFQKTTSLEMSEKILRTYSLKPKTYLLYVGAIQPRKNLPVLIKAFEKIKETKKDLKLVIAGDRAWMWQETMEKITESRFKEDIIVTGKISFEDMAVFYRNAAVFVFPELYAGFGIPILEAFAAGVPVIAADNSSLPEVGGDAALYFDAGNPVDLFEKIGRISYDENLRISMIGKGTERVKNFSWEKCARETLDFIKGN